MSQNWFADVAGVTRLDLPDIGGWIEVRNELSVGEERRVFSSAIKGQTPTDDGKVRTDYDAEKVSFGMVVGYLVDWSARDKDDKPVPVSEAAIKALKPATYRAIEDAVDRHAKALREARDAGKASGATVSAAAPTSPSAA